MGQLIWDAAKVSALYVHQMPRMAGQDHVDAYPGLFLKFCKVKSTKCGIKDIYLKQFI